MGLTALSSSLLRRRFSFAELTFLFCGMTNSKSRQIIARFASQWDSYLKYYTSWLAPMGVEILFLPYFDFAQFDKAKKDCSGQRDC